MFNKKEESIIILKKYFQDFDITELKYYLNNYKNESIPQFLINNIYDPEEIELNNFLLTYLEIVFKKIFYLRNSLNILNKNQTIKITFITDLIYWDDVFTIDNNIFINYSYIKKIFEKIEYNEYKEVNKIYINKDKIYDLEFLKKLSISLYHIIQYYNKDLWIDFITDRFNCTFIDFNKIIFKNKYNIIKNPNTNFINKTITVYRLSEYKIYGIFNNIYSNSSYSPYYEEIIVELSYSNGLFYEIDSLIDNKFKLLSNPFVYKAEEITNCILY